jgi:hypothetical protein
MNKAIAIMTRTRCIIWITTIVLLLTAFSCGSAQEPKPSPGAKAPAPPKGLRILKSGDSWHRLMPDYMGRLGKAADLKEQSVRWSGKPDEIAELLVKGEIDVMTWGRPGWSSGQLTEFLRQNVIENGLKGNPNFRLCVQMAWMVGDGLGGRVKVKDDYDNSKIEEVQAILDRERAKVEAVADELNKKYGRQFFYLVPLGDATTKLRAMIVGGKFPGVTKQSAIFSDAMPHMGPIAAELAAYCNYATIYRTSPVGLQIKDGVPEEQRVILQKLAWETVSKYPYAGVAK